MGSFGWAASLQPPWLHPWSHTCLNHKLLLEAEKLIVMN